MRRARQYWDPDVHDAELRRLHAQKLSDAKVAAEMGISSGTVTSNRMRLGLKANFVQGHLAYQKDRPMKLGKVDPLDVAAQTLPGFDRGAMTRHGHPIKLTDVMQATNQILKARGEPQIAANPAWLV